ncbi:MAG: DUF4352 domain-containing protein [Methanospirillum sp.]
MSVASVSGYSTGNQYMTPKPGYEFVVADFAVKNNGYPSGYSFNPYNVKLQDPDGYSYSYSWYSANVPGYFDMTTIAQGETARGKLVFEVPPKPAGTVWKVTVS